MSNRKGTHHSKQHENPPQPKGWGQSGLPLLNPCSPPHPHLVTSHKEQETGRRSAFGLKAPPISAAGQFSGISGRLIDLATHLSSQDTSQSYIPVHVRVLYIP